MPGLAGVVDVTGVGDGDALLERMLAALRSQDWHGVERCSDPNGQWAVGRVHLGFASAFRQPARTAGSEAFAFVSGRLHLEAHERRELANDPAGGELGDAELLLRIYEKNDGRLQSGLRGSFSTVVVDPKRRSVLIGNDTIGQKPIYYAIRGKRLLFGSTVSAILQDSALPRRMNREAMADLLEYRYVLGDKTLIEDVSLLAPGASLFYDLRSGEVEVREDASLDQWFGADVDTRPPATVLDEIAELFSTAVRRVCDESRQNTVSLSGGMDSRAIMSVIRPDELRINAFTSGLRGSVDEKITRRIARAASCESIYDEMDPTILQPANYVRLTRDAVALTDGMRGSSYHPMTVYMAEQFHTFGLNVVLTGHGGEFAKLDRAYGFSLSVERDMAASPAEFENIVFDKMSDHSWDPVDRSKLFTGKLASIHHDVLRASFEREFQKVSSSLPLDQQLSYFFLREFFRKHAVLSNRIHGNFSEIEYPFIAEDFVRAVLRAPLELRLDHRIHRHIIQSHNPALLQIPISDTRVRLDAGRLERLLVSRPYGILRRLGFFEADVPEHAITKRTPTNVFDDVLLAPRCLDRGDLDSTSLKQIVDRYKGGESALFHPLNCLLALELWNQLYIDAPDQGQ